MTRQRKTTRNGVTRLQDVITAANVLVGIEAANLARFAATGATAAKRDFERAVDVYLAMHGTPDQKAARRDEEEEAG